MFAKNNDELEDEVFEETEDADLEDEPSDEEEGLDPEDGAEDDELSDEEKSKPMTRGEFREWQKAEKARAEAAAARRGNSNNAARRVASKNSGKLPNGTPKIGDRLSTIEANQAKLDMIESKRQFAYENGLSPKETDVVFKLTKRPTAKFLKQPYVQGALQAIRSSQNVRDNTPGSGGRPAFKVGDKDFNELPADQKQANFHARRQAILEQRKGSR